MIERIPFGTTGHTSSRVIFGAAALGALVERVLKEKVSHEVRDSRTADGGAP